MHPLQDILCMIHLHKEGILVSLLQVVRLVAVWVVCVSSAVRNLSFYNEKFNARHMLGLVVLLVCFVGADCSRYLYVTASLIAGWGAGEQNDILCVRLARSSVCMQLAIVEFFDTCTIYGVY